MHIQNQTVVSLRYIMKNAAGDVLEDNMNAAPVQYVHGAGTILPSLESSLLGMEAGGKKLVQLTKASGAPDDFNFEIIVDDVRSATSEEILDGKPVSADALNCDADCDCHSTK